MIESAGPQPTNLPNIYRIHRVSIKLTITFSDHDIDLTSVC